MQAMCTPDMPESERWRQAVRQEWADADEIAAWRKMKALWQAVSIPFKKARWLPLSN
jgi:hypothetical protein